MILLLLIPKSFNHCINNTYKQSSNWKEVEVKVEAAKHMTVYDFSSLVSIKPTVQQVYEFSWQTLDFWTLVLSHFVENGLSLS